MKYKFRYYLGKICKFLGFCRDCRATLNFTKHGQGVCPKCSKRY